MPDDDKKIVPKTPEVEEPWWLTLVSPYNPATPFEEVLNNEFNSLLSAAVLSHEMGLKRKDISTEIILNKLKNEGYKTDGGSKIEEIKVD